MSSSKLSNNSMLKDKNINKNNFKKKTMLNQVNS